MLQTSLLNLLSAQEDEVSLNPHADFERKPRLNLLPAPDWKWEQLDEDLSIVLDNSLRYVEMPSV